MTSKELAYFEDAIMHEKNIISICNIIRDNLENEKLISFMDDEINNHQETMNKMLDMLEVKVNE